MYQTDKMNCAFVSENLPHILFNEVNKETYESAMEHIDSCSVCRERHREYLSVLFRMRKLPAKTPSASSYYRLRSDFASRFADRAKHSYPGFFKSFLLRPAVAYGLLSVLFLFTLFGEGRRGNTPPDGAVQASVQLMLLDGSPLADTLKLTSHAIDTLITGGKILDSAVKELLNSITFDRYLVRKSSPSGIDVRLVAQRAPGTEMLVRYIRAILNTGYTADYNSGLTFLDSVSSLTGSRPLPSVNMPADASFTRIREL